MPAIGRFPAMRAGAVERPASREYESSDWYETRTLVLAAGTAFQEVIRFSGRADAVSVQISAVPVFIRLRNRGASGGTAIRLGATGTHELRVTGEIFEVQDQSGAGGQTITVTGRYHSRHIDSRDNRAGPRGLESPPS